MIRVPKGLIFFMFKNGQVSDGYPACATNAVRLANSTLHIFSVSVRFVVPEVVWLSLPKIIAFSQIMPTIIVTGFFLFFNGCGKGCRIRLCESSILLP